MDDQAGYRGPCIRRPYRRLPAAPGCDSAKWSDRSLPGKISRKRRFRLQGWIVGAGFGGRFFSFRFGWPGRSDQIQNSRAFPEFTRGHDRLLLKSNVLVALRTNQGCVGTAVRLPEHVEAHDAPATHRNPHCGSLVSSHQSLAASEWRRLYIKYVVDGWWGTALTCRIRLAG